MAARTVAIAADGARVEGDLTTLSDPRGIVPFAHVSGSSLFSARNRCVAGELVQAGFSTLLLDLLTAEEEAAERHTRHLRFDIGLLADRLVAAAEWLEAEAETRRLPLGLFGASTGGGAALVTAARLAERIAAVVSRGGRPDLAGGALPLVRAPTLLLVGGADIAVIDLNQQAMREMSPEVEVRLEIVPGASHLFEEPGTLEDVARVAADWFRVHL